MMRATVTAFLLLVTTTSFGFTEDKLPTKEEKSLPPEMVKETSHDLRILGKKVPYKATVGFQHVKDEKGEVKATLFFTAYTRSDTQDLGKRPLTFCFNGGPGSSSVWLHLGALGPKRVDTDSFGKPTQPYRLKDNDLSLLDVTDLVFIDPVSTGYSRHAPGTDVKEFHSWDGDLKTIGQFVRLYTTRNNRWLSPKFLAGESYGGTRAVGLAKHLKETHNLFVQGLVLVSPALDFQTLRFSNSNDLPYLLYLPGYTAAAWYHQKLPEALQTKPLIDVLKEVETFSLTTYASALLQGDLLPATTKKELSATLFSYTSLPSEWITQADLRVFLPYFNKKLLNKENKLIGRFDARFDGYQVDAFYPYHEYDPSLEEVIGAFTACYNSYVKTDLAWDGDEEYQIIANVQPWDFQSDNQYLEVSPDLRELLIKNNLPNLFLASGYYDLAVPYFATMYTLNHLDLPFDAKNRITSKYYEAGHMMYLHPASFIKLREDLSGFYQNTLKGW